MMEYSEYDEEFQKHVPKTNATILFIISTLNLYLQYFISHCISLEDQGEPLM